MRFLPSVLFAAAAVLCPAASAQPADAVHVELNVLDTLENRCRATFVIENKSGSTLDSLKLDLAVFNPQQVVHRRLLAELGPVRAAKTIVKAFAIDAGCAEIGTILVNDVTCAPKDADACLEALQLSSRVNDVRLYK